MPSSALFPPNFHGLSDEIIGETMQRPKPLLRSANVPDRGGVPDDDQPTNLEFVVRSTTTRTTTSTRIDSDAQTIATAGKDSHRERRRAAMARYRKKLVDAASSHEKDIRLLWEEIRKLELQRKSIAASAPTTTTPWNVAAEYFRLFRHGYSAAKPLLAHESCVHLDFLRATMAPDVVDITSPNVEAMLENWRQFTLCYQDMDTTLVSLETCGESVIATSKTTLLITESALHSSFPQVVSNLQADQWRLVAAKLVGKTLEMNGVVRFDWDPATGRVVRMEYNTDMLTALLSLLGNVDDLSTSLSLLQRVL